MSFTKGPWQVDLELSDNAHIAINIPNQDGVVLLERHVAGKDQEDLPNAHLIAAAPELYELLHECIYNATGPQGLFDDIKKVLAKARGES